ncbi:MAG: hypothetical protein RLZZ15_798 [Verrucomicrobiota bacterium]|jgi:hypothetical protein
MIRHLEAWLLRSLRGSAGLVAARRAQSTPPTAESRRGGRCHCSPLPTPHLLHSEGLREACDFVVDFGTNVTHARRPPAPVAALRAAARALAPGATVHVKTELLGEFARHLLPEISGEIVLVTGESDASAPGPHADLLAHPKIRHWFAQNCDRAAPHARLTPVPIGLDNPVFNKLEKRLGFALTMLLRRTPWDPTLSRNDLGDQAGLLRVRATLRPTVARPARALCTFHQNEKIARPDLRRHPARREAWEALRANPGCHFVPRRLRQDACWRAHGDFAFEVSPHGNGLDCFRTWEALTLGTIPIVRTSPLDRLYREENFPVVIVEGWEEISAVRLARWHAELAGRFDAALLDKLTCDHWIARIKKVSRGAAA